MLPYYIKILRMPLKYGNSRIPRHIHGPRRVYFVASAYSPNDIHLAVDYKYA